MSGGAGASNRQASPPPEQPTLQKRPPLKRNLAFALTKPAFVPPDDYHSFSAADSRRAADHEAEVIIVRSPVSHSFIINSFGFYF
ncbi:hypothetical protein L6164_009571 [Bauhinia variegata]|uniref:Uncharacterized protein n=1 Tax=Bauhinia variegata TaxID=167791 RepID=A0ACB9PK58_BAUVA|nr:hypothetical protein L6164_009571 [Bauhinia variegata]